MTKLLYKTIPTHSSFQLPKIKGSRFIGDVFHVENKEDVEKYLQQIKEKYPDATHHCYACIFKAGQVKIHNDGEPRNTAAKPILNILQRSGKENVLLIVTRYYGGTKLGVGGLIQAYTECAKKTLSTFAPIQSGSH